MDKKVYSATDIRAEILKGIDFIVEPVSSTLGPRGHNVFYETDMGEPVMTNDGVTIAKNISSKNKIHQAVIEIIKGAALRTNTEGGDGTTTTTTLSGVLSKEALKLIDEGYSWVEIRDVLNELRDKILLRLEKLRVKPDGKKGLREIAVISANNDKDIADNVIRAINVAGEDGMVFIEPNSKPETELVEDLGFMVKTGIQYQELLSGDGKFTSVFKNVPVILTDKKLYYAEEAETILRAAVKAGHRGVVVVAREFMGEAVNTFIANHTKGIMQVMLVQAEGVDEKNNERLQDLATYLGGKIMSEKTGSLVNKVTPEDFVLVNQVFQDPAKTLFTPRTSSSKALKARIAAIKEELDKDKDNQTLKERLASLTTGVVTIKVGGHTRIETREKMYRYEDAIHATRSAMKHGHLVGGGTALLRAYVPADCTNKDFMPLYRKYTEAIARKIASNAGKSPDVIIEGIREGTGSHGYNARTGKFEDLLKAGVIDPYLVVRLAVENSVSVANTIVSLKYYMLNDDEDVEEKD